MPLDQIYGIMLIGSVPPNYIIEATLFTVLLITMPFVIFAGVSNLSYEMKCEYKSIFVIVASWVQIGLGILSLTLASLALINGLNKAPGQRVMVREDADIITLYEYYKVIGHDTYTMVVVPK